MENENMENMANSGRKSKTGVWFAVIIILILAVAGYFIFGRGKMPVGSAGGMASTTVATVNGVDIPKATYDTQMTSAIASAKSQGVDVTDPIKLSQIKEQVLNSLINNELVNEGVKSAGVTATSAEVEAQFQTVLQQAGGADKLKTQLASANMTEAELRDNISKSLAIQKYLFSNIATSTITVSDAEISQFYADYSKAQKAAGQKTVPALKDLSAQIKQQITLNKEQVLVTNFVNSLWTTAKIATSTAI